MIDYSLGGPAVNKKSAKRLKLHSETIRQINSKDLGDIAGGATVITCRESCPAFQSCPWYQTCV
jgi:hypothetical protein